MIEQKEMQHYVPKMFGFKMYKKAGSQFREDEKRAKDALAS